ncbi:MAG: CaiB/BaiF CoA transferase family protein [Paracoccaceae bacterium]
MMPLAGLRVVEMARILAGPWAGQLLADLGAEVVKVEAPAGDDTRRWGPPFDSDGTAAYFHAANRGKASRVIDFDAPQGREELLGLLATADVVIENFRTGALARRGLDYDDLAERFPRLVWCSITGFGQDGPRAAQAGYDFVIQGMSGLMSVTGAPDGAPQKVGVAVTDILTGLYAANGIQAALHARAATGRGQRIDVSLLDCAVAGMANQATNALAGAAPGRLGNRHPNIAPYEVYACADGHVILAVGNDAQFARLRGILGLEDDPAFATNAQRVAGVDALSAAIGARTARWACAELLAACEAAGVPAGPINDMAAALADPQIVARGLVAETGRGRAVGCPVRFSDSPLAPMRPAPRLGEG